MENNQMISNDELALLDSVAGELSMTKEELKRAASIDLNDLEYECARQAALYLYMCKVLTKAKQRQRKLRSAVKLKTAVLSGRMRNDPDEYRLKKITDKSIESAVYAHDDVQKLMNELLDTDLAVDAAQSLVTSFEHKKSMLSNEVRLFITKYRQGNFPVTNEEKDYRDDRVKKNIIDQRKKKHGSGSE